jgi:hypothetical protein
MVTEASEGDQPSSRRGLLLEVKEKDKESSKYQSSKCKETDPRKKEMQMTEKKNKRNKIN